jgi:BMFP domain-containing protein YqiC
MLNPTQFESIAKKVAEIIPEGFGEMPEGIQSQVKTILANSFEKMDLVTREEFDIQSAVLAKTRAKLELLEKQVADLEKRTQAK